MGRCCARLRTSKRSRSHSHHILKILSSVRSRTTVSVLATTGTWRSVRAVSCERASLGYNRLMSQSDYFTKGYFLANISLAKRLSAVRARFISVFNEVAVMNGLSKIKSDADVYKLYRGANRDLWVAAYDQLRFMPEVAELSSDKTMLELARKAGIKMPVFAARPILRADMPSDEKWEFPAHQDYPYNLGSLNCITIWIPFQDTPLELGALDVIPGSHLKGYVPEIGRA